MHGLPNFAERRLRTLVVEDEKVSWSILAGFLEELGISDISICTNGKAGFIELKRRPFDLVLTDLEMSPMSGWDLLREIRHNPETVNPYVPVIMITAQRTRASVLQARDAGANAFLSKPISIKEVAKKIRMVVESERGFIRSPSYSGPDRRWRRQTDGPRLERRSLE